MTTDISDHLAQFLIAPTLAKIEMKPKKILTSHENFNNHLRQVDWTDTLNLQLSNVSYSFEKFLNKINQTLDKHAPYKYINTYPENSRKQLANLGLQKEFSHQSKKNL